MGVRSIPLTETKTFANRSGVDRSPRLALARECRARLEHSHSRYLHFGVGHVVAVVDQYWYVHRSLQLSSTDQSQTSTAAIEGSVV